MMWKQHGSKLMWFHLGWCGYPVVLHPHVTGLVPSVVNGTGPVPPPQGVWRKLARGQVGRASLLLHLGQDRNRAIVTDHPHLHNTKSISVDTSQVFIIICSQTTTNQKVIQKCFCNYFLLTLTFILFRFSLFRRLKFS